MAAGSSASSEDGQDPIQNTDRQMTINYSDIEAIVQKTHRQISLETHRETDRSIVQKYIDRQWSRDIATHPTVLVVSQLVLTQCRQ